VPVHSEISAGLSAPSGLSPRQKRALRREQARQRRARAASQAAPHTTSADVHRRNPPTLVAVSHKPTFADLKASQPAGERRAIAKQQADARLARERLPKPLKLGFDVGAGVRGDLKLGRNLLSDAKSAAEGIPAGAYGLRHPVRAAKQIGKGYEETYGPLAHGHLTEFGHRFMKHPLGPLLDALSVASLGTTAAAKSGLLKVPEERTLALEGGTVHPAPSPNTLTRLGEHKLDRFSEKHPDLPVLGAKSRIGRRLPFERERAHERALGEGIAFARARKRLSKSEDYAFDRMLRYGDKAPQLVDKEIEFRRAELQRPRLDNQGKPIKITLAEKRGQRKTLLQLQAAKPHLAEPSPRLREAVRLGRELAKKTERVKVDVEAVTPESAAERVHLPARIIHGAEFERVPARQGRAEQIREYPGKTVTIERPRTRTEAEKRVAEIDAANEKILSRMTGEFPGARREQLRRNRINGLIDAFERKGTRRAGTAKALRAGRQRSVAEEVRRAAEARLDDFLKKNPDHPVVHDYLEREAEANYLRDLLNSPEDPFAEKAAAPDLGTVAETVQKPGRRVHLQAIEPQRAGGKMAGAELPLQRPRGAAQPAQAGARRAAGVQGLPRRARRRDGRDASSTRRRRSRNRAAPCRRSSATTAATPHGSKTSSAAG
jgi:hypothetical protein